MTSWNDRVTNNVQAKLRRAEDDSSLFHDIYKYMSDARSARDGETLERDGKNATLSYMDDRVLEFSVKNGEIKVIDGDRSQKFTDKDEALDYMASLTGAAIVNHRRED